MQSLSGYSLTRDPTTTKYIKKIFARTTCTSMLWKTVDDEGLWRDETNERIRRKCSRGEMFTYDK